MQFLGRQGLFRSRCLTLYAFLTKRHSKLSFRRISSQRAKHIVGSSPSDLLEVTKECGRLHSRDQLEVSIARHSRECLPSAFFGEVQRSAQSPIGGGERDWKSDFDQSSPRLITLSIDCEC